MSSALARHLAPLLARLPDPSTQPRPRQAALGLGVSLGLHALIFLFLLIAAYLTPTARVEPQRPGQTETEPTLELVIQPPPPAEKPKARGRPVLESRGLAEGAEKPATPDFESDIDMVAASDLPADGLQPLPSQAGRDRTSADFASADGSLGKEAQNLPQAPPAPPVPPLYMPNPVTPDRLAEAQRAPKTVPIPSPATTPRPRPRPEDKLVQRPPRPGELAFPVQPVATPPITRLQPAATPAPQMAMLATPAPVSETSFSKRFQQSLEKTRLEGSITNRGKPAVNAIATPMGRYQRHLSLRLWSRWSYNMKAASADLEYSTVVMAFVVNPDGKISGVQVVDDGNDRKHADVCLRSIQETNLDPLPADIIPMLPSGRLEMSAMKFSVLPPLGDGE